VRLCRNPIDGIKQLRFEPILRKDVALRPGENPLSDVRGDVLEILAKIEPGTASEIQLSLRGEPIIVRPQQGEIEFMGQRARVARNQALWKLRVILDRSSVEIFVNDGDVSFTRMFFPNAEQAKIEMSVTGGAALLRELEVYRLRSIWLKRERELGYDRRDASITSSRKPEAESK
jgi:sucrose-6-phosphate hydrolase SacC (GH32 family)